MAEKNIITICLDYSVIERLNELPNKSGFINQLLVDYFNTTKKLDELLEEKKHTVEVISKEIIQIEDDLTKAQAKDREMKQAQIEANKKWEESNERWERIAIGQRESMQKCWAVPKEEFEQVFGEFMVELRGGRVKNMIGFLTNKGYKRKEEDGFH